MFLVIFLMQTKPVPFLIIQAFFPLAWIWLSIQVILTFSFPMISLYIYIYKTSEMDTEKQFS